MRLRSRKVGGNINARHKGFNADVFHVRATTPHLTNYAEYTSVSVNSIPGRPGRAVFAGVTVGF